MAHELGLGDLGQARRLGAAQLLGNLGRGQAVVARDAPTRGGPACDFS